MGRKYKECLKRQFNTLLAFLFSRFIIFKTLHYLLHMYSEEIVGCCMMCYIIPFLYIQIEQLSRVDGCLK